MVKKEIIQSIENGNEIIIQYDDKIEPNKLDIKINKKPKKVDEIES